MGYLGDFLKAAFFPTCERFRLQLFGGVRTVLARGVWWMDG